MDKKELFLSVIEKIKLQEEKEHKFVDFLENGFIDGRCIPTLSNDIMSATIKLLDYLLVGEASFVENYQSDVEWFIYENDFGERQLEWFIDKVEYKITNPSEFYDVVQIYMKN
jgi:hypothetical protein